MLHHFARGGIHNPVTAPPPLGSAEAATEGAPAPPSPMQNEPPPQGPDAASTVAPLGTTGTLSPSSTQIQAPPPPLHEPPNTDSLYSPSSPASPTDPPQISNDSMLSKRLRARRTTGQPCRTPAPMLQPATARHHGRNRWRLIPWQGLSKRARSPFTR